MQTGGLSEEKVAVEMLPFSSYFETRSDPELMTHSLPSPGIMAHLAALDFLKVTKHRTSPHGGNTVGRDVLVVW